MKPILLGTGVVAAVLILTFSLLASAPPPPPKTPPVDFQTQIRPILEKRCQPCHFAGGKMYARMPFDKPQTILYAWERRCSPASKSPRSRRFCGLSSRRRPHHKVKTLTVRL